MSTRFKCQQLSVYLENRAGNLSGILDCLASNHINVRALSLTDTSDFGIMRLIPDNLKKTEQILAKNGFITGRTDVLAIEINDHPGALARVLAALGDGDINLEYMYACVPRQTGQCIFIFRFDKLDQAIEQLEMKHFCLIPKNELYRL